MESHSNTKRPGPRSAAARHRRGLVLAMGVGVAILLVELLAGLIANSLALLADAGHVFADVAGMAVSLGAIWLAGRPVTIGRSFGLYRLEILAAAANALLLLAVSAYVIWEGVQRFLQPPDLDATLMILAAAGGLGANAVSLYFLSAGRGESLTMRGAYLEVMGDFAAAGAVFIAGLVTKFLHLAQADAVASIAIGILILPRAWGLLRASVDVLLEATPKGVDVGLVRAHILDVPGVLAVHDLHAWTITSGMNVVSAHVVLGPDAEAGAVLDHLGSCLSDDFDIDHSTFQLESPEHVAWEGRAAQTQH